MAKPAKDTGPKCSAKTATGRPCQGKPLPGSTRCYHHSFKVPGRPGKLTADIQERIIDALLEGAYMETAAQAAGVGKTTLYRWLQKGQDAEALALEHFTDEDEPELAELYEHADPALWVYMDFRHALQSAEAFAELELLRRVNRGGAQPWTAYMTVLERRWPARWRRRDSMTHEGALDLGKPRIFEPDTPATAYAIAQILERAGALPDPTQEDPDAPTP